MKVNLSEQDIRNLISACWSRIVYLDNMWRALLAEGRCDAARVMHNQLMETQRLVEHLNRQLPEHE